jgi:hypothetical protein
VCVVWCMGAVFILINVRVWACVCVHVCLQAPVVQRYEDSVLFVPQPAPSDSSLSDGHIAALVICLVAGVIVGVRRHCALQSLFRACMFL